MSYLRMMLLAGLATACTVGESLPPEPDFTPRLTTSSTAIIWHGVDHSWLYNHRWGRLGSGFVYVDPSLEADSYPVDESPTVEIPTQAGWTYMGTAGAGTGADMGAHRSSGTRVTAAGDARFASMTVHRRIRGREGATASESWSVTVDLPPALQGAEVLEAILNGFWLESVGDEAKQPERFALSVDPPVVSGNELSVNVSAQLGVDCDTPECNGCTASPFSDASNQFVYDLYVDVLVIAGPSSAVAAQRFDGANSSETWDGPPATEGTQPCLTDGADGCLDYWVECGDPRLDEYAELPADAGSRQVQASVPADMTGTVGFTGFEFILDHAHHMIALNVTTSNVLWQNELTLQQTVRFQNWRHDMNLTGQDIDPRSATAFGTEGAFAGSAQLMKLGFAEATFYEEGVEATIITQASQAVIVPF